MKRWTRLGVVAVLAGALVGVPASPIEAADDSRDEWWSTRVSPVAKKVEELRGLRFRRPVPVDFLAKREFQRAYVKLAEGEGRSRTPAVLAGTEVMLQALDLLRSGRSLPTIARESAREQLLAYYDPFDQRVIVRGRDLGPATEVLLAHELTHALQDQHYGVARLLRGVHDYDGESARRALVEGDAQRITERYLGEMPLARAQEAFASDLDALGQVSVTDPWAGFAVSGAPYLLGPELVRSLRLRYGKLDRVFRNPPDHQVQVLNPVTAAQPFRTFNVTTPKLRKGERKAGATVSLGAITLFAALAQHLEPLDALRTADEWRTSVAIPFMRGQRPCVRAAFRTDNIHSQARMITGIQRWIAARPPGSAEISERGEITFTLESCASPASAPPSEKLGLAVSTAVLRNTWVNAFMTGEDAFTDAAVTKCIVDGLIVEPEFRQLLALATIGEESDEATSDRLGLRADELDRGCEFNPYNPDVFTDLSS